MKIVLFYHSLVSDWNHGNAHFLRGIVGELLNDGHDVEVYEPADGWSRQNLLRDGGQQLLQDFTRAYPDLVSRLYDSETIDIDLILDGADVVIVHEWNDPDLIAAVGRHRGKAKGYHLLFHDTHHRSVTATEQRQRNQLQDYDGVLAFGEVIRDIYLDRGWASQAWTWHEAADPRLFHPFNSEETHLEGDLVFVGNWGDEERSDELRQFLIEPIRRLQLDARVYGVRYPAEALQELSDANIDYGGWLPNYAVPSIFSRFRCTVHIPRRPYRELLQGVPTIRVFEALACGIPLVCLNWEDSGNLFCPGDDYLFADSPDEMTEAIYDVLNDKDLRQHLITHGIQTTLARHTCRHRVDELYAILQELDGSANAESLASLATES